MSARGSLAPAALSYLALGWSVIPVHTPTPGGCSCGDADCPSPGKHPRVAWDRLTRRRPDVREVLGWWRRWPDANVGVVTGSVSSLVVIDVDPRHGGDAALGDRAGERGRPRSTVESRTGGGGRHLWFDLSAAGVASEVIAPGLERKAEGASVVAPPSLHASGSRYEWLDGHAPWDISLARPPRWALAGRPRSADVGIPTGGVPDRTEVERGEFADAWREVAIDLVPGDRYYICPFHDDRHPSLHIDAEGCRWYCFGCGRGGGIGRLRRIVGDPSPTRGRGRIEGPVRQGTVTIPGDAEVPVVGEGRHQDELLALTGGRRHYAGARMRITAELVPEPDNRYDRDAIAVEIDGAQVGYLRHVDALAYRAAVDAARAREGRATCAAVIRGGWDRGRGDVGAFGVVLLLPSRSAA